MVDMRKLCIMSSAIAAVVAASLLAWAEGAPAQQRPAARVVAAETFLADIVKNVAGDRLQVEAMMPYGVDPHTYEPVPADVRKVAECQVLVMNGGGFEAFQEKLLQNAGGEHLVIEAAKGLTSRSAREGEVAQMSDADIADYIETAATGAKAATVSAGRVAGDAAPLPQESGLFEVKLARLADGSFGGYIAYETDEAGDFQVAIGPGQVKVLKGTGPDAVRSEKVLALRGSGLSRGYVVRLEKDGKYVLGLSGLGTASTSLLIGPLGGLHRHIGDPHFWLDPTNVIRYVGNIREGLSRADPAGAEAYARNAEAYAAQLKELDAWIAAQVARIPPTRRLMVTNHESFGYFADHYGFRIIGTIVPSVSTEASPSAAQLARLVDRIRAARAPAIFLETGASTQLAEQVGRETGIKVVTGLYTHSTSEPAGAAPTYIKMMRHNVTLIVEALAPK